MLNISETIRTIHAIDTVRSDATFGVLGATGLCALLLLVAALAQSRCGAGLGLFLGLTVVVLAAAVAAGTGLGGAVGLADLCYAPLDYVTMRLTSSPVALYYAYCRTQGPFAEDIIRAKSALATAQSAEADVLYWATNNSSGGGMNSSSRDNNNGARQHHNISIAAAAMEVKLSALSRDLAAAERNLDCPVPHNQVVALLDDTCETGLTTLALLAAISAGTLVSIVVALTLALTSWQFLGSRKGLQRGGGGGGGYYRLSDSEEEEVEEIEEEEGGGERRGQRQARGFEGRGGGEEEDGGERAPLLGAGRNLGSVQRGGRQPSTRVVVVASEECPICLDNSRNMALVPCGHTFCRTCGERLTSCPICRAAIQSRVNTY